MSFCQDGKVCRFWKWFAVVIAAALIEIGMIGSYEGAAEARAPHKATQTKALHGKGTILFVPQDDRPTSREQSADAVEKLGYTVLMPPKDLLGGLAAGQPDALWQWAEAQATQADAAVVSTDSIIYGGLVASRKHELSEEELAERVDRVAQLKRLNPNMKIYAFGSLMRTPASGPASGGEEPDYYMTYGEQIFRKSGLLDKQEMRGLTYSEKQELTALRDTIPAGVWDDWMGRREKNFAVTEKLIDFARQGTLDVFVLGKDDNAPLSATHQESRKLAQSSADVPQTRFQMLAGIDEFGMLLLARAVNDFSHTVPLVNIEYNWGVGGAMVPDYSDETIAHSIKADLLIAGAVAVPDPAKADLVLLVNTPPDGHMGYGNLPDNDGASGSDRFDPKSFAAFAQGFVDAGQRVVIADITRTNGADNALMNALRDRALLFRLYGYAGWNTATNSVGFALGQGMLNVRLPDAAVDRLLLDRYLDDWGYQSNVRTQVTEQLSWLQDTNVYLNLGRYEAATQLRVTRLLRQFAAENLPPIPGVDHLEFTFPWHRMFIGGITVPEK